MTDHNHGLVIVLILAGGEREFVNVVHDRFNHFVGGLIVFAAFCINIGQSLETVLFIIFVGCFVQTIGEHKDRRVRSDTGTNCIEVRNF